MIKFWNRLTESLSDGVVNPLLQWLHLGGWQAIRIRLPKRCWSPVFEKLFVDPPLAHMRANAQRPGLHYGLVLLQGQPAALSVAVILRTAPDPRATLRRIIFPC